MEIKIPESGVIKEQIVDIEKKVSVIYGYNNSGKTSFLRMLNEAISSRLLKQFILGQREEAAVSGQKNVMSVYIPTNRLIVSDVKTEPVRLKDLEEFLSYQRESYKNYDLHLKAIRDYLLCNEVILTFISRTVQRTFGISIENPYSRHSDGIENIINIYLCIIWAMVWDRKIQELDEEAFYHVLKEKSVCILIDELEMFLHVNIQEKLIKSLKEDFVSCSFWLTTHSPLILTRYKNVSVYEIEQGKLQRIDENLYYQDLDNIYEGFFSVKELPEDIREDINYLGRVNMKRVQGEEVLDKVNEIAERMQREYPNLYAKYSNIISKARDRGKNGKDKEAGQTLAAGRNT